VNVRCTVGLLVVGFPAISNAAGVRPETLKAWDQYIQRVELRTNASAAGHSPFLWIDQDPQRAGRVRRGEILAIPEVGANGLEAVPHGLIHDWVGAAFIPGVTLAQVFAVVEDYGRYNEFYKPTVVDAALLCSSGQGKSGEEARFRVRYTQKVLFTSDVLDSEYLVHRIQVDQRRWYSVAQSTSIQEFRDHGASAQVNASENGLVGDEESRYIWRIECISKYEQRDGGVYMEQENIVLSRSIPISLRWLVEPVIRQLSKDLTAASLQKTCDAVRRAAQGHGDLTNVAPKSGG
jgi:hypothetical protein